jgi:hypothetical protein
MSHGSAESHGTVKFNSQRAQLPKICGKDPFLKSGLAERARAVKMFCPMQKLSKPPPLSLPNVLARSSSGVGRCSVLLSVSAYYG